MRHVAVAGLMAGAAPLFAIERKDTAALPQEVKEAVDNLGKTFEDFRKKNDEVLADLKKGKEDVLTKAEWARIIATGLQLPNVEITEVPWQESGQIAPRPERVRLVSTRHELKHPPLLELLNKERDALLAKVN